MYLLKAIPISRGVTLDELSYWSPIDCPPGSVIRVPLRKRTIGALVISSFPVEDVKSEIKNADFETRKISKQDPSALVSPEFFATVQEAARYYAGSIGSTLFELIPAPVLAAYDKLPEAQKRAQRLRSRESFALQKPDEDRYGHYKSLVRERFARKESVFMILPTVEDIKKATAFFEKGIEQYTYILHGGLSKTEILKRWKEALEDAHPVVVVATGAFLSLPRADIGLVIVERENSRGYKLQGRPFLDIRFVAERFAKQIQADLIFGDACLSVDALHRHDEGTLVEYAPLSMRSLSTARDLMVDMKGYKAPGKEIRILSEEFLNMTKKNREDSGLMFVYAQRKGISPQTVCADCQTSHACDRCTAPLVLYGRDERRFFLCNRCGKRFDAHATCRACGSWRLTTLGIGTERVEEEISAALPGTTVFRLDKTNAPTHKKALEIAEQWYASPGSILVGTELALLYLDRPIDRSAVASLDSLFSIPDFRIHEKIFSIIAKMRAVTQKHFLLQTRNPEASVLAHGVKGNIIDFYREEIAGRKDFAFPPFSTFIKISYAGKREETLEAMEKLKETLSGWTVDVFPAFIATVKGDFIMHALLKLPRSEWPHPELLDKLRQLPPSYAVNVDPESIL